tara:strand:- start:32 stop:349 length:318 start_codon:yes stop_codon:yes gene_type:complete
VEEKQMRHMRNVVFGLSCLLGGVFLASQLVGAEASAQQQMVGRWGAEDCQGISAGSGAFLAASGELAEEAGRLRNEAEAIETYEGALAFSELAANFAKTFEVYCK